MEDFMNTITIKNNQIELHGFEKLSDEVTFAFYHNSICIFFKKQPEKKEWYINAKIENHMIQDKDLADKIKTRIEYHNSFAQTADSYLQMI